MWLKEMIKELAIVLDYLDIHCDSQIIIHLVDQQIYSEKTKYIDVYISLKTILNLKRSRI